MNPTKKTIHTIQHQTFEQEVEDVQKQRDFQKYESSKELSTVFRQLAFAGIAVVWMFRSTGKMDEYHQRRLLLPLLLFIMTIIMDAIFYYIRYYIYKKYVKKDHVIEYIMVMEKGKQVHNRQIKRLPQSLYSISTILWYLRFIFTIIAYLFLLINIIKFELLI